MNKVSTEDFLEEISNFESKVVKALSRLQKGKKYLSKQGRSAGVESNQIVDYLKANDCYLDGDIESQVITALLSCVKSGTICLLENGRYQLLSPNSKTMISNCVTRYSHGPKCCCLSMITCMSKICPNTCCYLKPTATKGGKKGTGFLKRKSASSQNSRGRRKSKRRCSKKKTKTTSPSKAPKCLVEDDPSLANNFKCNYCFESHPPPFSTEEVKEKKICKTCNPPGTRYGVPFDKFSPREELM